MPKELSLLACLILITLSACNSDQQLLHGHYYNGSDTRTRSLNNKIELEKENQSSVPEFRAESFMDFYSDGSYTMNIHDFEYGTYKYNGGTIYLTPSNAPKWQLGFKPDEDLGLGHFTFPIEGDDADKLRSLSFLPHRYKADHPFRKEFNEWRMNPGKNLSNNEMIDKVQNHFKFIKAYMVWANKVGTKLELKEISGPLRYANNGFGMRNFSKTGQWCAYFEEGDCLEMYYILKEQFKELEVNWKNTSNRIEMLADGLDQVTNGLDNYRENFKE